MDLIVFTFADRLGEEQLNTGPLAIGNDFVARFGIEFVCAQIAHTMFVALHNVERIRIYEADGKTLLHSATRSIPRARVPARTVR